MDRNRMPIKKINKASVGGFDNVFEAWGIGEVTADNAVQERLRTRKTLTVLPPP